MDEGNLVCTASYTMLTVTWCSRSQFCVLSGLNFEVSGGSICFEGIKSLETVHGLSFVVKCSNTQKSAQPPLWQTCKVLCPWALFRETTICMCTVWDTLIIHASSLQ